MMDELDRDRERDAVDQLQADLALAYQQRNDAEAEKGDYVRRIKELETRLEAGR